MAATVARRDQVEPLSADRSQLHINVSRQFTRKLEAARMGLGHSIRNATMEQALEAALDLLLEKQARARGLVKRPRSATAPTAPTVTTPQPAASGSDRQDPDDRAAGVALPP